MNLPDQALQEVRKILPDFYSGRAHIRFDRDSGTVLIDMYSKQTPEKNRLQTSAKKIIIFLDEQPTKEGY